MESSMTEIIEHRLNELGEKIEENRKDISAIKDALARVEENMKHTATKAWVLGGVLGGMAIAATMAVTIAGIIFKHWLG